MTRFSFLAVVLLSLGPIASIQAQEARRATGPWDVPTLLKTDPAAVISPAEGLISKVIYDGVNLGGQPTKVSGYYARPATGDGPFPAMLLVHGGGGTAFKQWAKLWAERGYVALAMDLSGRGLDGKRLPEGGPEQDDETKFRDFDPAEPTGMWTYHAVAAVLKGHALLLGRKEVDPDRIGVTGISWGGYLTCIVAGIDDRIKVAVPVYGCGFLHENSYWKPQRFDKVPPERKARWVNAFDPSKYLPGVTCPILFVNGTNDFAYPLDSYRKSYEAVPGFADLASPDRLCVTLRMPHGHEEGWKPKEIGRFVDSVLKDGDPLPKLAAPMIEAGKIKAKLAAKVPAFKAELLYAVDEGDWQKRLWKTAPAQIVGETVEANLPEPRPIVVFLNVTDIRDAVASSPQVVVLKQD